MYIIHIYVYYIYICITGNICLKKRRCPDLWGLLALEEHKLALKTQRETERRRERKRKRNRETIFHDSKCSGGGVFRISVNLSIFTWAERTSATLSMT